MMIRFLKAGSCYSLLYSGVAMKLLFIFLALLLNACAYTATPYGSSLSINAVLPYYYPYYNGYYSRSPYPYYNPYYRNNSRGYYNGWNHSYPRPYYNQRPWYRHR